MLKKLLKDIGFDNIGEVLTDDIPFEPSLIDLCRMNSCGSYGKSYTCPPYVGETEKLIEKAKSYKRAIVFQKIYPLEDSFDIEGMTAGKDNFKALTQKVLTLCEKTLDKYLILGAGPCMLCKTCGIQSNTPCRFPDKAVASLESYSIQVSSLASLCNMKYINGQNTVTYFGAVFCD